MFRSRSLIAVSLACLAFAGTAADDPQEPLVDVARFDGEGNLIVPADMDQWVFLGSSLGMGYSQADFDPDSPGMFQIARMEPQAYQAFRETGRFVDGTMIALHFFGSENEISINRAGFVMGGLHFAEIHYKDSQRFPDGAYDGVFVQFYPVIHEYLPEAVKARLRNRRGHHGS